MQLFLSLVTIAFVLSLMGLVFGLIRPVYTLWFLDKMNRLAVLKIYGWPALVLGIVLFISWLLNL